MWGFHFEQETWEADHYEIDTKNKKYVSVNSISQIPNELQIHLKIGQSEISQPFKVGSAGLL